MAVVEFKDVSRIYKNGEHEQKALDHVNLALEEGKFIVILGPSGAEKARC
jgi:putative ABC transport system ATP-binding protein